MREIIMKKATPDISLVSTSLVGSYHPARMYKPLNGELIQELEGFENFRSTRRQDLPKIFIRDGGFYLIGDNLVVNKMQYSKNPINYLRFFPWTINIDSPEDLSIARGCKQVELKSDPNED